MDDINDIKNLAITECNHKYHFTCMIKFANSKFNKKEELFCPICKQTITNENKNDTTNENNIIYNSDDSNDSETLTFENMTDRNNTMTFQNRSRYLGNIRASGNNSLRINMGTGLWEDTNDENNIGDYLDNTSDVNTDDSDNELDTLILELAVNI